MDMLNFLHKAIYQFAFTADGEAIRAVKDVEIRLTNPVHIAIGIGADASRVSHDEAAIH